MPDLANLRHGILSLPRINFSLNSQVPVSVVIVKITTDLYDSRNNLYLNTLEIKKL